MNYREYAHNHPLSQTRYETSQISLLREQAYSFARKDGVQSGFLRGFFICLGLVGFLVVFARCL